MSHPTERQAYVTLATTDSYAVGALVWCHSLRRTGTARNIVVLASLTVSPNVRDQLQKTFDDVIIVDIHDSRDVMNLDLLTRPDLGVTFTKLHCWRLVQYRKCVFMDADTMAIHNIDELFDREELSASPDAGWPDCFNSGVFVYKPSFETYSKLLKFALDKGSFDGGDQGLLNMYFRDWSTKDISRRLPFIYNVVSQAFYSYLPAFKQFGKDVKVVHFIGAVKPWHHSYDVTTARVHVLESEQNAGHSFEYLQMWWDIFMQRVQPSFSESAAKPQGEINVQTYTVDMLKNTERQTSWERGQIDYMGIDSFDNIKTQLEDRMNGHSH